MTVTFEQMKRMSSDFEKQLEDGGDLGDILSGVARKQANNNLRQALFSVRDAVVEGYPLSSAMAKLPDVFDSDYVARIRRGELNGNIEIELAEYVAA